MSEDVVPPSESEKAAAADPWETVDRLRRRERRLEELLRRTENEADRVDLERERAVKCAAELRHLLRWVIGEFLDAEDRPADHTPRHTCGYVYAPDEASCHWHEQWFAAAEACGVIDEWGEYAVALGLCARDKGTNR